MNNLTPTIPAWLRTVALDRLGLIAGPAGPATPAVATALLAELAHAGVRVANPGEVTDALATRVPAIVRHIRERRGQSDTFSPLFQGFPDKLPSFDSIWLRSLLASARLAGRNDVLGENGELTADALREALDFSDLGWWPASSVPQDIERAWLGRTLEAVKPADTRTEWVTLRVITDNALDATLKTFMVDGFTSAASLREDVKADLERLARHYGVAHIDATQVRFRETRTLLFRLAWEADPKLIQPMQPTPDDLLRLFSALTGSDVSLSERVRFPRLSRAQRRAVVNALEHSDRLGDIFRRRGLWLALDRGLHLGELTAPKAQEAFDRLRDSRHDSTSFAARFEARLISAYPNAIEMAAREAPGVLGRSLRRLAHLAGADPTRQTGLLCALKDAAGRIPLRVLLAARAQIADNGATYPRVVFAKTGAVLPIDNQPGHLRVEDAFQQALLAALDEGIRAQVAAKGPWNGQRVFIDPKLERVLLPDQLRSTAQGLVQAERGTRLPLGEAKVVRLFVHWRQRPDQHHSDLDLSCLALNANFVPVDWVSWTRLGNGIMTHSGDLTSAPNETGAQEFLDIDWTKARKQAEERGWRYLVPAVLRYAGPAFASLAEAHAGWMLRDACSSDRSTFDPATVVNAFALTGAQGMAVPMLVDLESREVLYVDAYLNANLGAMLERDAGRITAVVSAVAARSCTKVSIADLAHIHLMARGGTRVDTLQDATLSFGLDDDSTYNALRPEKLLADLL